MYYPRIKQLILFGEDVGAREAFDWGFAQWITPDGRALKKALEIADKAAQKPAAPASVIKQTVNALATALDSLGSHMDRDQFLLTVTDPESRQRITSSGFDGSGAFAVVPCIKAAIQSRSPSPRWQRGCPLSNSRRSWH